MEKCKFCQADLTEESTVCPACGRDNAEAAAEETVAEAAVAEETADAEEVAPAEETVSAEEAAPQQAEETAHIKEGAKATPGKIALMVGAIVVVAAIIIALLVGTMGTAVPKDSSDPTETTVETTPPTIPADGNPDDETCKGTYTATDDEVKAAADVVVATAGEYELTNGELQVYYWLGVQSFLQNCNYYSSMYGIDYAGMLGLDYTQPLDTQVCNLSENGATWQQFFLLNALDSWHYYQSFQAEAIANDFDVDAEKREFLNNLETSLEEDAVEYGFESAEAFLAYNAGAGASIENYLTFMEQNYRGLDYYNSLVNAIELTDAEIETYFDGNAAAYEEKGITKENVYVDVRHILVVPEATTAEDGTSTVTEEAWAASEAEAQRILALWENGGTEEERTENEWQADAKTEAFFAELANTYTADGNDANYDGEPDGGLYTGVYVGQMVEPFETWCFDQSRQTGDTGLVQTNYGWHVMYFVDSYLSNEWIDAAKGDLMNEKANELVDEISAKYPRTVDYSKILLGYMDLSSK